MKRVALICAIPQESRPILRRLGFLSRVRSNGIPVWSGLSADMQVILAESGIGINRAAAAAENIIKSAMPDIIISTGFCGAVRPGLRRGDIVLAENMISCTTALHPATATIDNTTLTLLHSSQSGEFHRGTFITAAKMVSKTWVAAELDEQFSNPVLEMESHAVAEVCQNHGISFAALRAVSDTADCDPQPVCTKIFNTEMKLSMMKLLQALTASPLIAVKLLRLHVDATAAGRSLAEAIEFSLERLR